MADNEEGVVGVIGLGAMGAPIAERLVQAGLDVRVCDVDPVRAQALAGARQAATPNALAQQCAAILVVVPTDADVIDVCTDEDGVMAGARPDSVVLICSSVTPATCAEVSAAAPDGVGLLDAALTGGVRGANDGTINLLVGGERAALDRARRYLAPWTKSVHHLGPLGAGQVGKTVNNLIHWAEIAAIYEALELGRQLGVPVSAMRTALMDGTTDSRTLRDLEHMRFTWYAKDLANAFAMAEGLDLDLEVARTSNRLMPHITVDRMARLLRDEAPLVDAQPAG